MKLVLISLGYLILLNATIVKGQDNSCPKISVGVKLEELSDEALNKIHSEHNGESLDRSYWVAHIQSIALQALSTNNPKVNFVDANASGSSSFEYIFRYSIQISPIAEGDYDFNESVVNPYSAFYYEMLSSFSQFHMCGATMFVGAHERNRSRNLQVVVEANVADHFDVHQKLKNYEKEHPVPPRAPEMTVSFDPDFVSPLKEERETEVKVTVVNCKGLPVYAAKPQQRVYYYPQISENGELSLPKGYYGGSGEYMGAPGGNTLVVNTKSDGVAKADYELQHGIEEGHEPITIHTCGLVSNMIKTEEVLRIKGLKVKVRPIRKVVYWEEETQFLLSLHKIDPDGGPKEPVEGKKLEVRINGLENGEIKPVSGYTTDYKGEVRLKYKAGNKDKKITVTAIFQPEDFPDKTTARNFVEVKRPEYDATVTISAQSRKETRTGSKSDTQNKGCRSQVKSDRNIDETQDATIFVELKLSEVVDMPIYNQTWEYYSPVNVNLSNFAMYHVESHHMHGVFSGAGCSKGGYDTEVTKTKQIKEPKISEPPVAPWIIAFDNVTKKAVKIMPGGYSIDYDLQIFESMESRQWNDDGDKTESTSDTKISENHNYGVGPVEDHIPDPSFKPHLSGIYDYLRQELGDSLVAAIPTIPIPPEQSDEVPEIRPDLLVQFGDGVKSFGGRGEKQIDADRDNGYHRENHTYNWQFNRYKRTNY